MSSTYQVIVFKVISNSFADNQIKNTFEFINLY